jgi:hypothetical protein
MTLADLTELLDQYAGGHLDLGELHNRFASVVIADPLNVEQTDPVPWERAPDDMRLLWRLIYIFESIVSDGAEPRLVARRVVRCLAATGSPDVTYEMLPLILDQERLSIVVARHHEGIISRTGFLSMLAESGYPPHVKLWLEHAPIPAVVRLCAMLDRESYADVMTTLERSAQ